jgi:hypothetical protein
MPKLHPSEYDHDHINADFEYFLPALAEYFEVSQSQIRIEDHPFVAEDCIYITRQGKETWSGYMSLLMPDIEHLLPDNIDN